MGEKLKDSRSQTFQARDTGSITDRVSTLNYGENNVAGNSEKSVVNGKPFEPGKSGNPSGRPKVADEIKEAFAKATPNAIRVLISILNNDDSKDADRLRAAETILDRHLGKAVQHVDMEGQVNVISIGVPDFAKDDS